VQAQRKGGEATGISGLASVPRTFLSRQVRQHSPGAAAGRRRLGVDPETTRERCDVSGELSVPEPSALMGGESGESIWLRLGMLSDNA